MSRTVATDLGARLASVEGMRAVAVFAVVMTHAGFLSGVTGGTTLAGLVARMDFGVAVFFVLSGFLLYLPHARAAMQLGRAPTVPDYALRRVARIFPAFWLCLIGTACLLGASRSRPPAAWAATALLVQPLHKEWSIAPLNHLWSLSTEVAFYVSLPLLAPLLRRGTAVETGRAVRRQLTRMTLLVALAWMFRVLVGSGHGPGLVALSWLPAHLDWFVAGMALAVLRTAAPVHRRSAQAVEVVVSAPVTSRILTVLLLWLSTTHLAGPYDLRPSTYGEDLLKHVLYLAGATFLVAPSAFDARDSISRVLATGPMVWLGTISFAVFLWHLPVMFAVQEGLHLRLFSGHFWTLMMATVLLTLPIAASSWYLLEHPVLRWAHRSTRRAPDPVRDRDPDLSALPVVVE